MQVGQKGHPPFECIHNRNGSRPLPLLSFLLLLQLLLLQLLLLQLLLLQLLLLLLTPHSVPLPCFPCRLQQLQQMAISCMIQIIRQDVPNITTQHIIHPGPANTPIGRRAVCCAMGC
jgi:hypothetical protein